MNIRRAWNRHPIVDGLACGGAFAIVASLTMPAWAIAIQITDKITIDLGPLPAWGGFLVAFAVYWEARSARKHAESSVTISKEAVTISKSVAEKVDGMLVDRDKAKVQEGAKDEKVRGEEKAVTLAEGQRQGVETERASVAAAAAVPSGHSGNATEVAKEIGAAIAEKVGDVRIADQPISVKSVDKP